jgi:hypothetical protein
MGNFTGKIPPDPVIVWEPYGDVAELDPEWKISDSDASFRAGLRKLVRQAEVKGKLEAVLLLKVHGANFLGPDMYLPLPKPSTGGDAGRKMDLTDERVNDILRKLEKISPNAWAKRCFQKLDDRSMWCVETLWLAKLHADSLAFRKSSSLLFMDGVSPDLRRRFEAVAIDLKSRLNALVGQTSDSELSETRLAAITTLSLVHADALRVEKGMVDRVAEILKGAARCADRSAYCDEDLRAQLIHEQSAVVALAKHACKFSKGNDYLADAAALLEKSAARLHTNWRVFGDEYQDVMLQLIDHYAVVMDRLPADRDLTSAREAFSFIACQSKVRNVNSAAMRVVHRIDTRSASFGSMTSTMKGVMRFGGPK